MTGGRLGGLKTGHAYSRRSPRTACSYAETAGPTPLAVVPFPCHQFPAPAQQCVRRDQRLQLVQRFATECKRFSGKAATFGVREADALSAQPVSQQAVLFLDVVDQIQRWRLTHPANIISSR